MSLNLFCSTTLMFELTYITNVKKFKTHFFLIHLIYTLLYFLKQNKLIQTQRSFFLCNSKDKLEPFM